MPGSCTKKTLLPTLITWELLGAHNENIGRFNQSFSTAVISNSQKLHCSYTSYYCLTPKQKWTTTSECPETWVFYYTQETEKKAKAVIRSTINSSIFSNWKLSSILVGGELKTKKISHFHVISYTLVSKEYYLRVLHA